MGSFSITGIQPTQSSLRGLRQASTLAAHSIERISSGLRINKASDDPGGIGLSERLQTASKGYSQAVKNINDGISVVSLELDATNELNSILSRLSELATEASNSTYTSSQRSTLDSEAQSLKSEYDRIIASTSFNNRFLLNGTNSSIQLEAAENNASVAKITIGVQDLSWQNGTFSTTVGDGTFQTAVSFAGGSAPESAVIVDVNGDTFLDLITGSTGDNKVNVSLGNGNGTFKALTSYSALSGLESITGADVNNDGYTDIITASAGANDIYVLLANSTGSFKAPVTYEAGNSPQHVAVSDLNGDGYQDLVVAAASTDDKVNVLFGNSGGTFNAPVSYVVGNDPEFSVIVDVDGNGYKDILTVSRVDSVVSVLLANSDATFKARISFASGTDP